MEISILLITYNHEEYVRQTLDSIIMQKINVPYEILVLDDASTDKTPEILRAYQKKYPQKISLYLRKNNRNSTVTGYFLLSKAKGKYFAFIEGDDYWTDEYKIQKQYDFLEQNPQYSGCMSDFLVVDENNQEITKEVCEKKENHIFTLEDFRHLRGPGITVAFFARNYFEEEKYRIIYRASKRMGDITIYMLSLLEGDIYQLEDVMAAYRYVCVKGKSNFNSIHVANKYRDYMLVEYWIRLENFIRQYDKKFYFFPMNDIVKNMVVPYPIKPAFSLLYQSTRRYVYLSVYLIYKLLVNSNYLLEDRCNKNGLSYDWNAFKKERRPIILFGSGAVAEEYLDKYGWQGNILFLVDNDQNKQNTSLKGFFIKKPEEMIRYKDRVKVLITNKFYEEEIKKQLEEMGITNYYCYCSMQTKRLRNRIASFLLRMLE